MANSSFPGDTRASPVHECAQRRQAPLAHHWRTKRISKLTPHSNTLHSLATATTNFDAQPSFSLPHRQPQSCLTTEKSRSRTPPALPSFPRKSPTSKAASSCSTRQAHYNSHSYMHKTNCSQWSYEEVEVRDISLTYVSPTISRRTPT